MQDQESEGINLELFGDASPEVMDVIRMKRYLSINLAKLQMHHEESFRHSISVANLANALCRNLGRSNDETKLLIEAALVHDFGKLQTAPELLSKTDTLSSEDRAILDKHVEHTREILSNSNASEDVLVIALSHHEHGERSYPRATEIFPDTQDERRKRHNKNIDDLSRLLSIIDAFQALGAKRSYQPRYTAHARDDILREKFPSEEDQSIVNCLLDLENNPNK